MHEALAEYLRLVERPNPRVLREYLSAWAKVLSFFAPFTAEELWKILGNEKPVSGEKTWPEVSERSPETLLVERYINRFVDDVESIVRVIRRTPRRINVYVAGEGKWRLILGAIEGRLGEVLNDPSLPRAEVIKLSIPIRASLSGNYSSGDCLKAYN